MVVAEVPANRRREGGLLRQTQFFQGVVDVGDAENENLFAVLIPCGLQMAAVVGPAAQSNAVFAETLLDVDRHADVARAGLGVEDFVEGEDVHNGLLHE